MKNYTLIIMFFISMNSFSQTNFFQTGAIWGFESIEHPETPWDPYRLWLEQIDITGDTIINNISYKKIHRFIKETDMPGSSGNPYIIYHDFSAEYIRFDSTNNSVFYISDFNLNETLIYNFNLTTGDTFPNNNFPVVIDSVENISLFGFTLKKYFIRHVDNPNFNPDQYIIEGMGGSNGLTFLQPDPGMLLSSYIVNSLKCFQWGNNVYPQIAACDVFAGLDELENNSAAFVYPNPFQKSFFINSPSGNIKVSFEIFDVLGKKVFSKSVKNKEEISDFNHKGLFFWRMSVDETEITSGKLIHIDKN